MRAEHAGILGVFGGLAALLIAFSFVLWAISGRIVSWMHGAEGRVREPMLRYACVVFIAGAIAACGGAKAEGKRGRVRRARQPGPAAAWPRERDGRLGAADLHHSRYGTACGQGRRARARVLPESGQGIESLRGHRHFARVATRDAAVEAGALHAGAGRRGQARGTHDDQCAHAIHVSAPASGARAARRPAAISSSSPTRSSKSRDWDEQLEAWKGWHTISRPMRKDYRRFVESRTRARRNSAMATSAKCGAPAMT